LQTEPVFYKIKNLLSTQISNFSVGPRGTLALLGTEFFIKPPAFYQITIIKLAMAKKAT